MKTTRAITTIKRDVKLQEWMEQIKAQQERRTLMVSVSAEKTTLAFSWRTALFSQ